MIAHAVAFALMLASGIAELPGWRIERAKENYSALVSGRKQLNQFTPQEVADIRALLETSADAPKPSPSERCFEEQRKLVNGSPSELEQRIIDLRCRPLGESLN